MGTLEKMGTGPILQERGHSQLEDITAENGACPHFFYEGSKAISLYFTSKISHTKWKRTDKSSPYKKKVAFPLY